MFSVFGAKEASGSEGVDTGLSLTTTAAAFKGNDGNGNDEGVEDEVVCSVTLSVVDVTVVEVVDGGVVADGSVCFSSLVLPSSAVVPSPVSTTGVVVEAGVLWFSCGSSTGVMVGAFWMGNGYVSGSPFAGRLCRCFRSGASPSVSFGFVGLWIFFHV